MPALPPSSSGSASCRRAEAPEARIDWRPSRLLAAALLALALLAVCALLASEAPRWLAWPGAALVVVQGIRLLRREASRPRRACRFRAGEVAIDGVPVQQVRVRWRGPLVFLQWREGDAWQRLSWWPDTLPPARRRELRLAAPAEDAGRDGGSVAP